MNKLVEFRFFKYLLSITCLVVIIISIYINHAGKKQDAVWLSDFQTYNKVLSNANEGNYAKTMLTLNDLGEKYNSASIFWNLGKTKSRVKNYSDAKEYYDRAREIYPAIVLKPDYIKGYALLLVEDQDYKNALRYFEVIQSQTKDKKEKEWADFYIESINKILNN